MHLKRLWHLCQDQLRRRYPRNPPAAARERLEYELNSLQGNELLCSILLTIRHLTQGLRRKGYLTAPGGSLAASYAAYLLGVTVDPLVLHIPCEPLLWDEGHWNSIALNVSSKCWDEAIEILSELFPQSIAAPCRVQDQRIFVPSAEGLRNWIPLQKSDGGYTIPDDSVYVFFRLFSLYLFCAGKNLSLLRRLEELTGVSQSSINVEEAVPFLLQDQTNILRFRNTGIQPIWKLANPKTINDIIKVFALSDFTGAWHENGEKLLQTGTVPFSEIIGSEEDVFRRVLDAGLDRTFAYQVMERVRAGKRLDKKCVSILLENGIPEWFIHSCSEITNLLPEAHYAMTEAIPALKAAWYKAHLPKEYAQVCSELCTD